MLTAQALVERSLAAYASRVAVVDGDRTVSYGDLADRSGRLANALLAAGAGLSRPVATLLPNCLEFIEIDVACTRAGMTRVGISERLSADEARYILADSQAAVLVASRSLLETLDADLPDTLELVIAVGDAEADGADDYEEMLARSSPRLASAPVDGSDPNYILYTSGTTGRPKGATHSHAGRAASTLNMLASELWIDGGSAMVHAGPLTHGSGSKIIGFLAAGGRNIVMRRFDPHEFGRLVTDLGGTHTFLVPTMIQRLLEAGDDVGRAVSRLRQASFGGAPIAPTLFRRAIERFGPVLTQVYGSCEAPHPVTLLRPADYLADGYSDRILTSAGRVAHGIDIRLTHEEGEDVAEGIGELWVRAPSLMIGYWRSPEATAQAFDGDGWYSPGDLATIDEDGIVTFRDRKKDLIITGGLNVYPSEVERVIAEHPGVREVAVVGAPDEEWGEGVLAYVVPRDGTLTSEEIIAWTRDRLASYKKPKHVEFLDRLPLGSSNKVLKRELRERLWRDQDRQIN